MSCPKCAELEAQLAEAREENAEHMNDAIQDGQAVKRFMDLNTTLTESVAEYKKLYYDTRTRAELIRTSLTERVVAAEAVIKVARTVRPGIYPERTGVDALRDALKVYDASQTRQDFAVATTGPNSPQEIYAKATAQDKHDCEAEDCFVTQCSTCNEHHAPHCLDSPLCYCHGKLPCPGERSAGNEEATQAKHVHNIGCYEPDDELGEPICGQSSNDSAGGKNG